MRQVALLLLVVACSPKPAEKAQAPVGATEGRVSLVVAPNPLDLGTGMLGERLSGELTLVNAGEASLAASAWAEASTSGVTVEIAPDFADLEPGASAVVRVTLDGTIAGRQAASVWVEAAGVSPAEVTLVGELLVNPDADADGHDAHDEGGDDCDDQNAAIYPGSAETWYDGIDQDCDGGSDFDQDGDGYDRLNEGEDCDDENPSINPGAVEIWYDGVDQDCDARYDYDQDRDGFDGGDSGPDCADTDPTVHPDAADDCALGLDLNCDGRLDGEGPACQYVGDYTGDASGALVVSYEAFGLSITVSENCAGSVNLTVNPLDVSPVSGTVSCSYIAGAYLAFISLSGYSCDPGDLEISGVLVGDTLEGTLSNAACGLVLEWSGRFTSDNTLTGTWSGSASSPIQWELDGDFAASR